MTPRRWTSLDWRDRDHPDHVWRIRTGDDTCIIAGSITVQTYRDYLAEYRHHPEAKAAGLDGQPCRPDTVGLLIPLTVEGDRLERIGQETNRIHDDDDLADLDDALQGYAECLCRGRGSTVQGRRTWCSGACRKRFTRNSRVDQIHRSSDDILALGWNRSPVRRPRRTGAGGTSPAGS